jgi:hypothetical protein
LLAGVEVFVVARLFTGIQVLVISRLLDWNCNLEIRHLGRADCGNPTVELAFLLVCAEVHSSQTTPFAVRRGLRDARLVEEADELERSLDQDGVLFSKSMGEVLQ